MSWSIDIMGTRDAAKAKIAEQLDKVAATYAGKPEADDVLAVKARLLALVDACALGTDAYGTDWNAVKVSANGSHGITNTPSDGLTSAGFSANVSRIAITL